MFSTLTDKLVCPVCRGALHWRITAGEGGRITEADAGCTSCGRTYGVREGIADFSVESAAEQPDLWEEGDKSLTDYLQSHPDIAARLMDADVHSMNAADLMFRAMAEKALGHEEQSDRLLKMGNERAYTRALLDAVESMFVSLMNILRQEDGPVVDIASGMGALVRRILSDTALPVVATDISPHVMRRLKADLAGKGWGDRVSFLVFDARRTPFADGTLPLMTTFAGLQNLSSPGNIIGELRRISSGVLYSVCQFCSPDDEENRADLRRSGIESMWIREQHLAEFQKQGWTVGFRASVMAEARPTPRGVIVPGAGIDGFPVAPGIFEHCLLEARV